MIEAHHIAPCYAYRDQRDGETELEYGQRVADELEAKLIELGPDTVIAFIAEPVVGATLGAVPAVMGYFKRIRQICDRYGVLLILDEVMCGMGRTGTLHACTQEGVAPDIMVIAKGLGRRLSADWGHAGKPDICEAIAAGSGAFQHGHTYIGHATACAAALAVQQTVRDEHLLEAVQVRGKELATALAERFAKHSHIGNIRGRGLFRGLELVARSGDQGSV